MRSLAVGLVLFSWVTFSAAVADEPPGGGAGGVSPSVRGLSPASRRSGGRGLESAARGRIPGRGPDATARTVGPNFRPQQTGTDLTRPGVPIGGRAAMGRDRARIARALADGAAAKGKEADQREGDVVTGSRRPTNHPQHHRLMLQADLVLARRLADIDRLRDVALANGKENLLLRADQLEQQARLQHDQRIARLEAFPTVERESGEGVNSGLASPRVAAPSMKLPAADRPAAPIEPTLELEPGAEPLENPAADNSATDNPMLENPAVEDAATTSPEPP